MPCTPDETAHSSIMHGVIRDCLAVLLALTVCGDGAAQSRPLPQSEPLYAEFSKLAIPKFSPTVCDGAFAVRLVDVDGDGDLDLVVGGAGTVNGPRLYLNDGHGVFVDVTATHMPPVAIMMTWDIAYGDLNGDGKPDLVIANVYNGGGTTGSRVLINTGNGHFSDVSSVALPLFISSGSAALSVKCVDVDNDGELDIILADGLGGGQLTLLMNDGHAVFSDGSRYVANKRFPPLPAAAFRGLACGDINGDGFVDVLVGIAGGLAVLANDGKGWFTDVTQAWLPPMTRSLWYPELGDINGDGLLDIVTSDVAGRLHVFCGNGKSAFIDVTTTSLPPASASRFAWSIRLFDIDADGDLDIFVAVAAGGIVTGQEQVLVNDGNGVFHDATAQFTGSFAGGGAFMMDFGDVDGDGDVDIVLPDGGSGKYAVCRNRLFINRTRHIYAEGSARIGRPYAVDVYGQPGKLAAIWMAGSETTGVPMTPFGMFRLPIASATLVATAVIASVGVARVEVLIPANPSLVGQSIYSQSLVVDIATPSESRLTGVWKERVER